MPKTGKQWNYIEDPITHVSETARLQQAEKGMSEELKATEKMNKELSKAKTAEITSAEPVGVTQRSN